MTDDYLKLAWVRRLKSEQKDLFNRLRKAQDEQNDMQPLRVDFDYEFLEVLNKVSADLVPQWEYTSNLEQKLYNIPIY